MPIHDWTRIDAGGFHAFHNSWIAQLQAALNGGLLPKGYSARGEQVAGDTGPDVLTLASRRRKPGGPVEGAVVATLDPPRVRRIVAADPADLAEGLELVVRHHSGKRTVAIVEIVSRSNKGSRDGIDAFLAKCKAALAHGVHLLILDLFPPNRRNPHGIHPLLWEAIAHEDEEPGDKPLTLAAYEATAAGLVKAYVQPVAVGDELLPMPLFLEPDQYVLVPLEATYRAAFAGMAEEDREAVEQTVPRPKRRRARPGS